MFGCYSRKISLHTPMKPYRVIAAKPNGEAIAIRRSPRYKNWHIFSVEAQAENRIALKSVHGRYLGISMDKKVLADKTWSKEWEMFRVVKLFKDNWGTNIALKSAHGYYVGAYKSLVKADHSHFDARSSFLVECKGKFSDD